MENYSCEECERIFLRSKDFDNIFCVNCLENRVIDKVLNCDDENNTMLISFRKRKRRETLDLTEEEPCDDEKYSETLKEVLDDNIENELKPKRHKNDK